MAVSRSDCRRATFRPTRLFHRIADGRGAPMDLTDFDLNGFVAAPLAEDLGGAGHIAAAAVIPGDARFAGVMRPREPIVAAGLPVAEAFFRALDPAVAF